MEEVEILCDRIIILDKGEIIASGTAKELKELTNIEEKVTVEVDDLSIDIINELNKFKNIDEVIYDGHILYITFKKEKIIY